jgi:hypothetical protein
MYLKKGDVVALTENDKNPYRVKVTHLVRLCETKNSNAKTYCALGVWSRKKHIMSSDKKVKGPATCLYCYVGAEVP